MVRDRLYHQAPTCALLSPALVAQGDHNFASWCQQGLEFCVTVLDIEGALSGN